MSGAHCTPEQLYAHLAAPDDMVAAHIGDCAQCREELDFTREFDAALREPNVWDVVEELRQPSVVPPATVEAARLMEEQDRAAADLLAPALVSIGAFREHEVEVSRRFRSPGVVRVLVRAAKRARDSSPKFGLLLASTAVTIASKLPGQQLHPTVVGAAWLERGIAAAMIGSYRDSEDALRRAEKIFDERGNTWDIATVWLSRANVYSETERFEEALALSSSAADVFMTEYADVSRHLRASLVRGTVLFYRRIYHESILVFESMLATAEATNDVTSQARALHNAAYSYVGIGELDKAETYYLRALVLWDQLGFDSELARTQWLIASIEMERGNWAKAYEGLNEARRQFAALGLANDEALVLLEIAEVLIMLNRGGEVPLLLDRIVVRFANEGMTRNARLALAWLSEGRRSLPTRTEVRHVRDFIGRLPTNPSERFVPIK